MNACGTGCGTSYGTSYGTSFTTLIAADYLAMYLLLQLVSAVSAILFLLLLPFRLSKLLAETSKVVPKHGGHAKTIFASLLLVVQVVVVVITFLLPLQFDISFLAVSSSFLACIGLIPLVFLEHRRSIKPSDLVVLYLLVSLACDSAELGTTTYRDVTLVFAVPAIAKVGIKVVLLLLESKEKEKVLRGHGKQWPPEQLAGVLSKSFFWWINPILAQGGRGILSGDSLPPIDRKLSSRALRLKALRAWDQRAKPESKMTLPKAVTQSMLLHFLAPIVPRLFLIAFRYAQPILISRAISHMTPLSGDSKTGYTVILMAVIIYLGLAISKGIYQHRLNRLKVMIRGAVVGLINSKSLSQQFQSYDDGKAVTLMSTDTENVVQSAQMFHETWAQAIEVLIGTLMLAKQVGWISPVPLVIIFFCSRMSSYLAKNLQDKQKNWNLATQKRLAMITSMLGSMKSLKMIGVTTYTQSVIHALRLRELDMAKKVRWMMVAYNASANALGIFSPIITFVLFVLLAHWNGSILDSETAFTTTALLGLVTHPANMIMSIVPQAVGSLAAFDRIQQYLLQPPRRDQRLTQKAGDKVNTSVTSAIHLDSVTIRNNISLPPILEDISMTIDQGAIVVCSGPVGCGKTTLAKAIIGELPVASGTISVASKRTGYCEQSPWLPSGTLKDAICGYKPHEAAWYSQVIQTCCLEDDILALPHGEQTLIGSRGLNLSGGQRQRVALARAVYARCDIVLLDDSFSALDGKTESRVVENLLGSKGLFKQLGTTVLLMSNSAAYFSFADWLVILGNSSVKYQGALDGLIDQSGNILKVQFAEPTNGAFGEKQQQNTAVQRQNLQVAEAISDLSRATGDYSLYGYYLRSAGVRNCFTLLVCTLAYSFFITFPQYWLQKWTEAPPSQTLFYVGGYLIMSLLAWTATNGSMWAPLSYFSATDTGIILNRFSQDVQLVDRQLPPAILAICNQVFKLLVEGIATIRAFGWEDPVENANIKALDKSQQPFYILQCLQQWLNLVLDLMVAAIATGLITLAVLIQGTTTAAQIGMALNIVLVANTTLLGLLEAETPKEEQPGENYIPVESWPSSGKVELDGVNVAYNGDALALQDINIKVAAGHELIVCGRTGSGKSTLLLALLRLLDLKTGTIRVDGIDLSLVPRSLVRQRCFITVAQDLFVLGHASLRFNLDPSTSLLDENIVEALKKTQLWTHFKPGNSITSANKVHQILNSPMASLPHMSTGQYQMFSLARAILQLQVLNHPSSLAKSQLYRKDIMPILLLDEATSSLDPETEATMRRIIQEEFTEKGHTTISITHRMSGVSGSVGEGRNMIALLSQGKIEKLGNVRDVLGVYPAP
ncbi:hypothetical protein E8E14_011229 [Neopestalotiopsis sp. 37M]|nr:hypothetical protein E8E14_011229 [Neopestalotiopsis sp. 37M]